MIMILGNILLNMTQKSQAKKAKIYKQKQVRLHETKKLLVSRDIVKSEKMT